MSEPTTVSDAPLTVTGERTKKFDSSLSELSELLRLDGDVGKALGRRFSVVAAEDGIRLGSERPDAAAPLFLPWSQLGPLRAESLCSMPFDVELVAEVSVSLLACYGIGGGAMEYPALVIPVTAGGATVELKVTVAAEWDIAERFEALRGSAAPLTNLGRG